MIACGGSTGMLPIPGVINSRTIHLATSQRVGSHIFPGTGIKPFLAGLFNLAMFQATSAASRLQQSYDAVCNFQPGFVGQYRQVHWFRWLWQERTVRAHSSLALQVTANRRSSMER
jgi:hypothetical protein